MQSDSTASVLVDTNVLVYAVDRSEGAKSRRANEVVQAVGVAHTGVLNSQVVTEFYAVTTRPRRGTPPILDRPQAARWVDRWLALFDFRAITDLMVREAVRGAAAYQMNIYDSQVWAAAKLGGLQLILSEDGQSRTAIEGVRYVNPFAPGFELSQLGL